MPVQTIIGDIGLASYKPLDIRISKVPLAYILVWLKPSESLGLPIPTLC